MGVPPFMKPPYGWKNMENGWKDMNEYGQTHGKLHGKDVRGIWGEILGILNP